MSFDKDYCDALSLTRLRRELPPGGSLFMFIYSLSIFLTSTAFVATNAKYGIPLSRYTVLLQNCPLGYDPKGVLLFGALASSKVEPVRFAGDSFFTSSKVMALGASL